VDPYWLCRNIASSWVHAESVPDFFRCLAWTYSAKLPAKLKKREWAIGFRYPAPVGSVRLLLRANSGSDAFIQGEVFHHRYYEIPLASPPETILDLGANTGMTAVYFGRAYPAARLACVEPVPDNLRVLARNLRSAEIPGRTYAVCGILADKDAAAIAAILCDSIDAWWCVSIDGNRGRSGEDLAQAVRAAVRVPVHAAGSVAAACAAAAAAATSRDRIVVFGSFHTVGPALDWFEAAGLLPSAALPEYTAPLRAV